ncbi:ankyrin repeat domain family member sosondowah isoform X3 [Megachile rotundata]|uniref:ankyrin repeat domain family member sosondowah isoform X3 n=1 Tax=Megachile rotundata TaxID=143995 RepID=UPI003FD36827
MATPSELSIEEIRQYLLENGGTARNHDVVKHFKKFLTDPETRVEARNRFKEYVNTLATIKNEEGEKYLVLKKKYRQSPLDLSTAEQSASPIATPDLATPVSPLRVPPPYRPPPPAPQSPSSNNGNPQQDESSFVHEEATINEQKNGETGFSTSSPPVPPRRKSQDKIKLENKENVDRNKGGSEAVIKGADEDDSASVASQLDGKSREWLVRAAQGDYQALAKLAAEEPRLARLKDPTSVSMGYYGVTKCSKVSAAELIVHEGEWMAVSLQLP